MWCGMMWRTWLTKVDRNTWWYNGDQYPYNADIWHITVTTIRHILSIPINGQRSPSHLLGIPRIPPMRGNHKKSGWYLGRSDQQFAGSIQKWKKIKEGGSTNQTRDVWSLHRVTVKSPSWFWNGGCDQEKHGARPNNGMFSMFDCQSCICI